LDNLVTGSIVAAFVACPRQAWLMARQMTPDEENVFVAIGKYIHETSYSKERKEIVVENMRIDLICRSENDFTLVGEIKKSSRTMENGRMQLLFYLYRLRNMGIHAEGELLFPKERRREKVILTEEEIPRVEKLIQEVKNTILMPNPPPPVKSHRCSPCAYREFCWA